jgi:hypothetical protein
MKYILKKGHELAPGCLTSIKLAFYSEILQQLMVRINIKRASAENKKLFLFFK